MDQALICVCIRARDTHPSVHFSPTQKMNITCPQCGYHRDIKEEKLPPQAQMATCPKCRHKFQFRELVSLPEQQQEKKEEAAPVTRPEPQPMQQETSQRSSQTNKNFWQGLQELGTNEKEAENEPAFTKTIFPSWEDTRRYGFVTGFMQTLVTVLFHPVHFFQNMRTSGGLLRPLIFYLLIIELQLVFNLLLQGMNTGTIIQGNEMLGQMPVEINPAKLLLLYPPFFAGSQFFVAALNHLLLVLSGGTGKDFEATFRVACYGSAPFILSAVFAVLFSQGPGISAAWSLVCVILGYKTVHSVSLIRAAMAVFLPLFIAMFLLLLLISSMGAA